MKSYYELTKENEKMRAELQSIKALALMFNKQKNQLPAINFFHGEQKYNIEAVLATIYSNAINALNEKHNW